MIILKEKKNLTSANPVATRITESVKQLHYNTFLVLANSLYLWKNKVHCVKREKMKGVRHGTHNRAGVVILDVDLPQKSALVVLIHEGDRSGRRRSDFSASGTTAVEFPNK